MDYIDNIASFLRSGFLAQGNRPTLPDGRLLYLYDCSDDEFWCLVRLLKECGVPSGYDFGHYRQRWQMLRQELQSRRRHPSTAHQWVGFWSEWTRDLDWTIRGFVLYASEFWRRFKNDEWRNRHFPDDLPYRKLTWAQVLSLVGWGDLCHGGVRFVEVGDEDCGSLGPLYEVEDSGDQDWAREDVGSIAGERRSGNYPGLYFPMLAAWEWWRIPPLRLPTSIRYLDTFAQQGGVVDSLVIEYELVSDKGSKAIYQATRPPNGYGADLLALDVESRPPEADWQSLEVTVVFGGTDRRGDL